MSALDKPVAGHYRLSRDEAVLTYRKVLTEALADPEIRALLDEKVKVDSDAYNVYDARPSDVLTRLLASGEQA